MAERSIVVRLRAEVSDFKRQMGAAADSADSLAKRLGGAEKVSGTVSGRLVQSMRHQSEAWNGVADTAMKAGAAVTGVGVAAMTTGVKYNQLQQTSRAALTTLMGSASAAADQMDRLDEFAKTSPFAKDVFIRAQRQMLSFGIETRKVIPYLDAIQNAVGAAGGSNQDIAELARIFSQVHATAKLTATDLREFGNRGVDAAALIGAAMGKTGAQIRSEITAGTLDAGEALDALAAGMQNRFGGAADNIKNTLVGAFDRVKAAWRDISSDFAEPFVGKEGGGLGVLALNKLADAMRAFQDAPTWLKAATTGVVGLTGASMLLGGAAVKVGVGFVEFQQNVRILRDTFPELDAAMTKTGGVTGTVAGAANRAAVAFLAVHVAARAFMELEPAVSDSAMGVKELARALDNLGQSGATADQLFSDLRTSILADLTLGPAIDSLAEAQTQLDRLADPTRYESIVIGLTKVLGIFDGTRDGRFAARMSEVDAHLTSLAGTDLGRATEQFRNLHESFGGTAEQGEQLLDVMPGLRDTLVGIADGAGLATDNATLLKIATGEIVPEVERAAAVFGTLAPAIAEALEGFGGLVQAYDDAAKASDNGVASMSEWIAQMEAQAEAVANWQTNILAATEQVRTEMPADMQAAANGMLDELLRLGPEGAAAFETFVNGTAEERARLVELWSAAGADSGDEFAASLEQARTPTVRVDTSAAFADLDGFIVEVNQATGEVSINGNTVDARDSVASLMGLVADQYGEVSVGGYTMPANTSLAELLTFIKNSQEFVTIDGDPTEGRREVGLLMQTIAGKTGTIRVDANTQPARGALTKLMASFSGRIVSIGTALMGRADGGVVGGRAAGGRVPGPTAPPGVDNVLWPLAAGGTVLSQPLAGGEFVVNSTQTRKNLATLEAINAGTYRPQATASVQIVVNAVPTDKAEAVAKEILWAQRPMLRGGRYTVRG